jgi:UDP-glucose 4-epimerase
VSVGCVQITGAAGFIGSHLAEALLVRGWQVHATDVIELQNAENLDAIKRHPSFYYTSADLRDSDAIRAWYRADTDILYHLASIVGVRRYIEDPLDLIDIVVGGTRNLLELASRYGTRVLFASTSEIYGKNPNIPWREDSDRVLGPTSIDRWSYSSSKAVCEHMLFALQHSCNLPFTIVRFFNVYGPRQAPIFLVSQSVFRALRGEPPLLYDRGQQTRCFTYVEDVIEGIIAAATSPHGVGEAFNLGNTEESTVSDVIDAICRTIGFESAPRAFDTAKEFGAAYEDITRRVPSVEKATRLLGWEAKTKLQEGIGKTVAWARKAWREEVESH